MCADDPTKMPGDLPDIVEALEVLGMSAEEARLYLHLLQVGPSKVGQLSPYFDVSRSKLYQLLDDLSRKGFVAKTPERPTVYHPVFPEEAFEVGREEVLRRYDRLERVREDVLGSLQHLHRAVEGPEPTDWTKIEGTERIYEVIQRVVDGAETSLRVASNHEPSVSPWLPFVQDVWSMAQRKVEHEDVRAQFLLGPPGTALEDVPGWVLEAERARVIDVDHPVHFVVADEEVVVFWVQAAPARSMRGPDNVAVHTDARAPVGTHVMLFDQLWSQAAPPQGEDARSSEDDR